MRDLFLVGFLGTLLTLGLRHPFLFVLAYAYVDIVSPHRLSWYLLNSLPVSMITAVLAIGGWALLDRKHGLRVAPRQWMLLLLLLYAGLTTWHADLPVEAYSKWEWAWKALAFAIFLPFTLSTKLRIEALLLFMTLSAAAIIIVGGIKTILSGGGYGVLRLMVDINSGLYESSTISTIAIALVPIILWLARFGTVFPPDWRTKSFAAGLIFACLLIPIGTEARTGLVCVFVLALLMLRDVKRRLLYMSLVGLIGLAAVPLLPQSFTSRMETIGGYQADSSASVRIAVWKWTLDYVRDNPMGGGFDAYRQNRLQVPTVQEEMAGDVRIVAERTYEDRSRAYHSAYFEMLGEQGIPGLILYLLIHGGGLVRMEMLRRRYAGAGAEEAWIAPLATAFQHFQIIFLVGALFVGIAYQPFMLMMIGAQIGFDHWVGRRERERRGGAGWNARPALSGV